jgi:hypothetical protein
MGRSLKDQLRLKIVLALKVIGNVMLDFTEWKKAPVLQRKNRNFKFLKIVFLHLR